MSLTLRIIGLKVLGASDVRGTNVNTESFTEEHDGDETRCLHVDRK